MASGHAKVTGEVGVCLATSGPGAIHLLNGLYDAKLDQQARRGARRPVGAASPGGHFQQEVDLLSLFKDVAGDFVQVCTAPEQARHLIDRAFRIAKSQRIASPPSYFPTTYRRRTPSRACTRAWHDPQGRGFPQPIVVPA